MVAGVVNNYPWDMQENLANDVPKKYPYKMLCCGCGKKIEVMLLQKPELWEKHACSDECFDKFYNDGLEADAHLSTSTIRFVLADLKRGNCRAAWEYARIFDITVAQAITIMFQLSNMGMVVVDKEESQKSPVPKWRFNSKKIDKTVCKVAAKAQNEVWGAMFNMIRNPEPSNESVL